MNCIETNDLTYRFSRDQLVLDKVNIEVPVDRFMVSSVPMEQEKPLRSD